MQTSETTVVVTGANSGIGKVTALELARMGLRVVMVCRSRDKAETARSEIVARTGNHAVSIVLADFADLVQVARAAAEIRAAHPRIDVLVNNAGIYLNDYQTSAQGYEMTFAVNHLAPFLLTKLLLDAVPHGGRVVNVSSMAHNGGKIDFDDLHQRRRYSGFRAYGDSKLANILFSNELALRVAERKITSNSLHPGVVASNFAANNGGLFTLILKLGRPFMISSEEGARTSIYLSTSPEVAEISGKYFDKCRAITPAPAATDTAVQQRLWSLSEELIAVAV